MPGLTLDAARGLVAAAPAGRLATLTDTGAVDLVPIVFALLPGAGFGRLVTAVDHKPKTTTQLKRLANLGRDPRATVLVDRYDDDWTMLWWVRLRGEAEVVDAESAIGREAIDALCAKYPQYDGARPAGPVISLAVHEWVGWAWSG